MSGVCRWRHSRIEATLTLETFQVKAVDICAYGRAADSGDLVPSWMVLELDRKRQEEIYLLSLELADARGWNSLGPQAARVWEAPAAWKTDSQNKTARRIATRVLALMKRARELLGGQIGFDNFIVWQLLADLTGSGVWRRFRMVSSPWVLKQVWENQLARKLFEAQRRSVHIMPASQVNALKRASHSSQRNMTMTRAMAFGQVPGNEKLLQQKYLDVEYQSSIVPNGRVIDQALEVQPDSDMAQVLEDAQRAANARAELAAKREADELETIKSEAQREFEQYVKPLLEKAAESKRAKAARAAARKAASTAGDTTRAEQVGPRPHKHACTPESTLTPSHTPQIHYTRHRYTTHATDTLHTPQVHYTRHRYRCSKSIAVRV